MASVEVKTRNEAAPGVEPVDMKLEVVMIGVADISTLAELLSEMEDRT